MRIFELRVDLGTEGVVSRSIKAEFDQVATKLMRLKFPDCRAVTVVSSREQSAEEIAEEGRIRDQREEHASKGSSQHAANAYRNGILIILFGTIASFFVAQRGWLIFVTLAAVLFGIWKCLQARSELRKEHFKRRHER